jgi:hypothetical protein
LETYPEEDALCKPILEMFQLKSGSTRPAKPPGADQRGMPGTHKKMGLCEKAHSIKIIARELYKKLEIPLAYCYLHTDKFQTINTCYG